MNAYEYADKLEADAKAIRKAQRTIDRIVASHNRTERHWDQWEAAEKVLREHGLSVPNSGLLLW